MRIRFIEQNLMPYLVAMPVTSDEELKQILLEFDQVVLLKTTFALLDSGRWTPEDMKMVESLNPDVGLTPEQTYALSNMVNKFPEELAKNSYEYKVEMMTPFLEDLLEIAQQFTDEELKEVFLEMVGIVQLAIQEQDKLTEESQADLENTWERIREVCINELDAFNYVV